MSLVEMTPLRVANRVEQVRVFGLVTMMGYMFNLTAEPTRIDVSVGSAQANFEGPEVLVPETNGYRVQFNLMSHLVPNGPTAVLVRATFSDGTQQTFPAKPLVIANDGALASQVADDLRAHGTGAIQPRIIDSTMFPYRDGAAEAWFDEIIPADVPISFEPASDLEAAHRHLERWGFCILHESLPEPMMQSFKVELERAIESGQLPWEKGSSQRIHNAHHLASGRDIWLYPPVLKFLKSHFRDVPCACQTLTYVHGSEQNGHQDTIHLTPYPAGFMCGVWVALEDVQENSGELFVYPGSHKAPRLRAAELGLEKVDQDYSSYIIFDTAVQRLMAEGGFERATYRPRAGQILVWHENLVHGGSPRIDSEKTRLSIVSHYFAKGAVAYYDSRGEAAGLELLPEFA